MSMVSDLPLTTTPSTATKLYASNAGVDEALEVETLLGGFAGGKEIYGGTASGEHLDLFASADATPGMVRIGGASGSLALDEANVRIGLGTLSPDSTIHIKKSAGATIRFEDTDGATDQKIFDITNIDGSVLAIRAVSDSGVTATNQIRILRDSSALTQVRIGGTTGTVWRLDLSGHLMASPIPTSEPADLAIKTSQAIIYGDEGADKLKVKWRKSDGTIVKGDMSATLT